MTATHRIFIQCDGSLLCAASATVPTTKASIARAQMMKRGWSCTPAGDFCPECAKARKGAK